MSEFRDRFHGRKLNFVLIRSTALLIGSLSSPVALGEVQEFKESWQILCGVNLAFFGIESGCLGSNALNPYLSVGLRYSQSEVMDDDIQTTLGIAEWRPMRGSFHIDMGVGLGRFRESSGSPWLWRGAGDVRMGNRWSGPSGFTLGLQYAGFQISTEKNFGVFPILGPEIGWRFE